MKNLNTRILFVALLCSLGGLRPSAQETAPTVPVPPPPGTGVAQVAPAAPEAPAAPQVPPRPQTPGAPSDMPSAHPATVPGTVLPPPPGVPPAPRVSPLNSRYGRGGSSGVRYGSGGSGGGGGSSASSSGWSRSAESYDNLTGLPLPGRTRQFLVLPSADTDDTQKDALEEDLAVMSNILEKSAGNKSPDRHIGSAMWVPLLGQGSQPLVRGLYLGGYGLVFLVNVDFPLMAPPDEASPSKVPAHSSWEQAKREVLGGPDQDPIIEAGDPFAKANPEYDPKKVEELKRRLVEALKETVNIRNLKPDDIVQIAVMGPAKARQELRPEELAMRARYGIGQRAEPKHQPANVSVLSIRVKVGDAVAFGKGESNWDEFRPKVRMTLN